ncbi:response regulator [Granulicella sibirica]|uniref:Metal-dependent hydrolases of the beta-lactamase superfamily I n=1 Tax=Granulicella sibirica TaxID=2479048 RepID=A0A4Q0TAX7_9BACT|nr:response regulator [Granulicella sibirica]RXH58936.1 Metal-dependent hydrolases of the beta-lactamase superfamily I [Granulicella sibirica]
MRVRFWGTRGSIATPGPSTVKFGGNTLCVEVVTDAGQRIILDCGTGVRLLGMDMMKTPRPHRATILIGHTHWDHIQGFPFFAPVFIPGNEFTICAAEGLGNSLANVLAGQMEFTYFPVKLDELPGKITYRDLSEGAHDINGVRVLTQYLNHPAICLGYRIEADGVAVVYLTDHEPFSDTLWRADAEPGKLESILHPGDRRHAEFMAGADLVIHDSQYTPREYPSKKNWGHSTYEYAVELATVAGVKQLALIHHDPLHDDEMMAEIEQQAIQFAAEHSNGPRVFCACEGGEIVVIPSAATYQPEPTQQAPSVRPQSRLKVLVADDDSNIHLLAESALARDFDLSVADDGEQCLAAILESTPDLLVLDLNMPNMDGLTVLKRLRADTATDALPVLVLTAAGDEGSTRAAFEAGATDYLTKPFTIPQLTTRVTTCLARVLSKS